jgi:hypothetical protein
LCRSGCTFRLLPVSKSSRNPACRKLTITVSSVKQTRQSVNCQFTLPPAPDSTCAGGAYRTRAVLQRVLRGRIVFRPERTGYTFTAQTRFDRLFSGIAFPAQPDKDCRDGKEGSGPKLPSTGLRAALGAGRAQVR